MNKTLFAVALVAAGVQAEIVSNEFWAKQDHEWANFKLGVKDGIAYGMDAATEQFIKSGQTAITHAVGNSYNYMSKGNVDRVSRVFTQSNWNDWLPNADAIYTYDKFLRTVAKFPAFCGESNAPLGLSEDDTCRREVASIFAHIQHNSEGLTKKEEATQDQYRKRGPMALKGDKEYAEFSKAFYEGFDRSQELLDDPDRVATDGYVGLGSAMWKYMVK